MNLRLDYRALLLVVTVVTGAACHADLDEWNGEHLDYYSSPSLVACTGTHEYVDRFVPFVAGELGVSAPTDLEYQWLDAEYFIRKYSGKHRGFARRRRAYSLDPFLLHEVVHTIGSSHGLNRWPFFTEGLASAYDPWLGTGFGPRWVHTPIPEDPLPDPRSEMTWDAEDIFYGTAGSFVAFLLNRHGPAKFVAFVQDLPTSRNMDKLRERFRDVYGIELDDEAELFMVGAPCEEGSTPIRVYDCAMPEIPMQEDAWFYEKTMDCEDEDVVGGTGSEKVWRSVHGVTMTLPTDGQYALHLTTEDEDTFVQIGACFGCPWEPRYAAVGAGNTALVDLDAGPYYVRILSESDRAADVQVLLAPEP